MKHFSPSSFRGVTSVRADTAGAMAILADLQKTFAEFKAEREAEIKALRADVVQTEKVDRINAEITRLSNALNDTNAAISALKLSDTNAVTDAAKESYRAAFDGFFRHGADAGLQDLAVKAGLTTQSKPDGGYLVPTQMESTIDRVLATVSAVRSIAGVMGISSPSYTKLVNVGGAGAGWVGEEESRVETATPSLKELEFVAMELYAEPYATQIALDDAAINLEQWLADEVAQTFADQEGSAFISGNGVKRPRGFLSYNIVANSSFSWGNVGYVASGGASSFASSNPADAFVDLYFGLRAGYRSNASWIMSDATLAMVRKFKDGQGNYLWAPPTAPGEVPTILQKPVVTDDNMPAVGANAYPVAFGDFRRGYLIVDRMGIRVLRNPYKANGKVAFYTTKRVGGGVANFEAIKLMKIATS